MKRLIDAEALIAEMGAGCMPINEKGISGITGDNSTIKDYIDNAPTEVISTSGKQNVDKALKTIENYRRGAIFKRDLEQRSAEKYCEGFQDGLDKAEAILSSRDFEGNEFEGDIIAEDFNNRIYLKNPSGKKCDITEKALKAVFDWFMLSGRGSVTYPGIPYKLILTDDQVDGP